MEIALKQQDERLLLQAKRDHIPVHPRAPPPEGLYGQFALCRLPHREQARHRNTLTVRVPPPQSHVATPHFAQISLLQHQGSHSSHLPPQPRLEVSPRDLRFVALLHRAQIVLDDVREAHAAAEWPEGGPTLSSPWLPSPPRCRTHTHTHMLQYTLHVTNIFPARCGARGS